MFNVDFIAAQVGAEVELGGEVFEYGSKVCETAGELKLDEIPVPLATGGKVFVWARPADKQIDPIKYELKKEGTAYTQVAESTDFVKDVEYCIMYRKAVDGKQITVSSQFIPDTVHAVLTVALYSGDSCDVESATKAGEITIDIPRLQLTGAMDLSMTATGACQTPLEGNALASGCSGCDGKAVYATITQFITGKEWYDNFEGLLMEDPAAGAKWNEVKIYAYGGSMAAKEMTLVADNTSTPPVLGKFEVVIEGVTDLGVAVPTTGTFTFKSQNNKDNQPALKGTKTIGA